jgi:hypothetical protein
MSQRIFYHGTREHVAYSIMQQGFKVGEETSGRNLRAGLYITPRADFAALWGPIVIRLCLVAGTRILWHTPVDPQTIRSLKKEFGAGIVKPKYTEVIPANKQLTKSEVAHLWNYLIDRYYLEPRSRRRGYFYELADRFPFIYKHLKRHGYDGVAAIHEDWHEMFLFNPSNAVPLSAHSHTSGGWGATNLSEPLKLSKPLTLEELRVMQETELRRVQEFTKRNG